ncbi:Glutamate--cysteine ligase [Bifidobacterium kimbladii]|uniref:Glutamate--cysteine ligase n=2 Tax=Bifidobacterium TaxID=1678 RepID=A0A0F4L2P9_9BIFI|nr:Glutamate--cysteine ligase [Bifidobacterium asteroides]
MALGRSYHDSMRKSVGAGYAHLLTVPNPRHVASLVDYFTRGSKPRSKWRFGIEVEHLPVRNDGSDAPVPYEGERGIEALLSALEPCYDGDKEYREDGHLVGLSRPGCVVSLEPGSQVECSLGVVRDSREFEDLYRRFRAEVDPIAERLGFRLVEYGYRPAGSYADVGVNPKERYAVMNTYLGRIGQCGPMMMRSTASTQISIDYRDEDDAIAKIRLGTAIGPIVAYFFRNTPIFEGKPNRMPLRRQRIWDWLDTQRTGLIPGLFEDGFGWEDYAVDMLSTPLMVADVSHTPEVDGPQGRQFFIAWHENAGEIYPDRRLNDAEIAHILTTHFNDVRLKNYIELRHWDSLPMKRASRLLEIVGGIFYDSDRFAGLVGFLDGVSEEDVLQAKADLQAHGGQASPYGHSLDFWRQALGAENTLDDLPGDPRHPERFQS